MNDTLLALTFLIGTEGVDWIRNERSLEEWYIYFLFRLN